MNWTIPEFVNRSVWSPAGTRLALGTTVWPRSAKNSMKRRRISPDGRDVIRGSRVTGGVDIGRNGTEPDRAISVTHPLSRLRPR